MLAAALWLTYALPAYIIYPLIFRARHGFSAVKERFPPRTRYEWTDFALGVSLTAYSISIALPVIVPSLSRPLGIQPAGLATSRPLVAVGEATWLLGCSLRVWSVWALGRNWRIGQDDSDSRATHVSRGPYRFLKHPINAALILVVAGMSLLTGLDTASVAMLAVAVLYYIAQGRAEERFWAERRERHQP